MRLTASSLRADVYRILDQVLETGVPVLIERKGKMLKIVAVEAASKLDNLEPRPFLAVDPEELVSLDWSAEWEGETALEADGGEGA
jgi:hypothetical protein